MPLNYNPEDAVSCLPAGEYLACLTKVEDKVSKKGNNMQELTWSVFANGGTHDVKDYIVSPSTLFKLKALARAWGMSDAFEAGQFQADDHIDKRCVLVLDVQQNPGYDDRNGVKAYKGEVTPNQTQAQKKEEEEAIPF